METLQIGKKTWLLYLYGGSLFNETKSEDHGKTELRDAGGLKAGDVVRVQVNIGERTLQFFLNEKPLGGKVTMKLQENELQHLVPALCLYNLYDAAKFV